jgi:NAD(P)-dependent dehydrogenase (short-subunit alcohol dehydrogenase family)
MTSKTVIVAGGTTGMGRATALARAARGDTVTVIGRTAQESSLRADLSSIAEVERVDALALFANRPIPRRTETVDGLEYTFALYYLSRYLLAARLAPLMTEKSVIINVSGVGAKAGGIHWEDPQLTTGYGLVKAQLQAGRANDLLGVAHSGAARYVLYHPGFTKSGLDGHPSRFVRGVLKTLATVAARPVEKSVAPIVEWIDNPPKALLTASDRGKPVDLSGKEADATRLMAYTESLLAG